MKPFLRLCFLTFGGSDGAHGPSASEVPTSASPQLVRLPTLWTMAPHYLPLKFGSDLSMPSWTLRVRGFHSIPGLPFGLRESTASTGASADDFAATAPCLPRSSAAGAAWSGCKERTGSRSWLQPGLCFTGKDHDSRMSRKTKKSRQQRKIAKTR